MVKGDDGTSYFWDPAELRKRIEFASIGLDLCLDREHIEAELRRSLYAEMTREDLKRTIILNAKALMEKDADFARFAGRILLSYIYEEVLNWDILADGIEGLQRSHQQYFKKYLKRAVEIERLAPDPARLRPRPASPPRSDPTADLDFDYLGVSTMYDRYLLVDKTCKPAPPHGDAPALLDARQHGPLPRGKGRPRTLGAPALQSLQEPSLLLLHADTLQLRHAALTTFVLLPLPGQRQH